MSTASKVAGIFLIAAGVLTLILVSLDMILWETSTVNAVTLLVFGLIDLVLAAVLLARPYGYLFLLVTVWNIALVAIWFADIVQGPTFGATYAQFAAYLFNPIASNPPNPPGVPGALVDSIIALRIIVIIFGLLGYHTYSHMMPYFGYMPTQIVAGPSPFLGPPPASRFPTRFASMPPTFAGQPSQYASQLWGVPQLYETCTYCGQQLTASVDRRMDYCPYCNRYQWHHL